MQAPMRLDDIHARPQHEMKGITQNDFRAGLAQLFRRHALDRAIGADRHEGRRLHRAALKHHAPAASGTVGAEHFEFQTHDGHGW